MSVGKIIIVSGPSGVGKGTVLREVMRQNPSLQFSVSATTRPIRPKEVEGVNYFFVDKTNFEQMISDGQMLEYALYADNYYGTPLLAVEAALARGISVVLEIEVQGALQVMKRRPDALSIFIAAPSFDELKKRLEGRGDTPPEIAAKRLLAARWEYEQALSYQYILVNDSIDRAVSEFNAILSAENCADVSIEDAARHAEACKTKNRKNIVMEVS
ncbi:MAG: guanylate kinase [Oscillospiraceae bacterium]|jgi:guanylate kinase|nr:guanylate kinase [Oscillospiraceae bacterium]